MKSTRINFGEGIRIFHQGDRLLTLVFNVIRCNEKDGEIEILQLEASKNIEIKLNTIDQERE